MTGPHINILVTWLFDHAVITNITDLISIATSLLTAFAPGCKIDVSIIKELIEEIKFLNVGWAGKFV